MKSLFYLDSIFDQRRTNSGPYHLFPFCLRFDCSRKISTNVWSRDKRGSKGCQVFVIRRKVDVIVSRTRGGGGGDSRRRKTREEENNPREDPDTANPIESREQCRPCDKGGSTKRPCTQVHAPLHHLFLPSPLPFPESRSHRLRVIKNDRPQASLKLSRMKALLLLRRGYTPIASNLPADRKRGQREREKAFISRY